MSFKQQMLEILLDWEELSYRPLAYLRRTALGDTRSHSERALQMRLYRMTRRGEVSKLSRGGKVFFSLTDKGRSKMAELDELAKLEIPPWDGKWRIVSFDFPETESSARDQLRRRLSELGFGMLQRSVWLSPRDLLAKVRAWIENRGMQEYAVFFAVERVGLLASDQIVEIAWTGLGEIGELYEEYPALCETTWEEWARRGSNGEHRAARAVAAVVALRHRLSTIVEQDPLLPRELLPERWGRDRALNAFRQYRAKFRRVLKKK